MRRASPSAAAAPTPTDPGAEQSARDAGLRYSSDAAPGVTRKRQGTGFSYWTTDHRRLRDTAALARIRSLAIPPAWTDVWICPAANGHIQATGRDARRRKQYRYHPRWNEVRDEVKYGRLLVFAEALPRIRRRASAALKRPGLTREKVLAALVQLLEKTLIRVGNEEYARTNGSFGLTTMQDRHVEVKGTTVLFAFRAKSGVRQRVTLSDRTLARTIARCQDLPGQTLFQYEDDDGQRQSVDSGDVNDYLRSLTGQDFTAKDFRTWAGTVLAAQALRVLGVAESETQGKRQIVQAVEQVAAKLRNTKAVCRKCYIHPSVLDAYLEGGTIDTIPQSASQPRARATAGLSAAERAVVSLLRRQLRRQQRARRDARKPARKAA